MRSVRRGSRLPLAGLGTLLLALVPMAVHAAAGPASLPAWDRSLGPAPPAAQRIAATTAFADGIEAKIADGTGATLLQGSGPDVSSQADVLDYGLPALWAQGDDGAGTTVAFIVPTQDPALPELLQEYDSALGLPAANLREITYPRGEGTPNCRIDYACDHSADESAAEAIHTLAPYAHLLFVTTPMVETLGIQGWPQIGQAIEHVADDHLANVISIAVGDTEANFAPDPENPGSAAAASVHALDPALLDAAADNVPVLVEAGECGATGARLLNPTGNCTPPLGRTAGHPSDSPWVTAVGSSVPNPGLATAGGRTGPDTLWTTPGGIAGTGGASGAGVSRLYGKPVWESQVAGLRGISGRAYPDLTMDVGEPAATLAGILAIATQVKGGDLGAINAALYAIGPQGPAAGIVTLQSGESTSTLGVSGYRTGAGYSIAAGWGTVDAPRLVPALVGALTTQPSTQAATQLTALRHRIGVSASSVPAGTTLTVTGRGFVPGATPKGSHLKAGFGPYPPLKGQPGWLVGEPTLSPSASSPGQSWDTIQVALTTVGGRPVGAGMEGSRPDGAGTVRVPIDTSHLAAGRYRVTIRGDELTEQTAFTVTKAPPKPWWDPF